jgi:hypothetical protein
MMQHQRQVRSMQRLVNGRASCMFLAIMFLAIAYASIAGLRPGIPESSLACVGACTFCDQIVRDGALFASGAKAGKRPSLSIKCVLVDSWPAENSSN